MKRLFEPDRWIIPLPSSVLYFAGALVGWIMLAIIYRLGVPRLSIISSILSGPSLLLLTYFAFGGNIPRAWRERGVQRWDLIPPVSLLCVLVAVVYSLFLRAAISVR